MARYYKTKLSITVNGLHMKHWALYCTESQRDNVFSPLKLLNLFDKTCQKRLFWSIKVLKMDYRATGIIKF